MIRRQNQRNSPCRFPLGAVQPAPPLLPELIHNLRQYPRALEVLAAMRPEDWRAFNDVLERVFAEKAKKDG